MPLFRSRLDPADDARKEIEDAARKYGWRPKGEFDRDPSGWVDADRFLELPATRLKMTNDAKRELERELKNRDERLARIDEHFRRYVDDGRLPGFTVAVA